MRTIIFTILVSVFFIPVINAETNDIHELGVKGYSLTFDMQYEAADKILDEMIRMEPENALGYFLKSKKYIWMYIFGSNDMEHINKFADLSYKTIEISKKMLKKNKDDIDALFYLGNTYGYLGRWYGEEGKWIKAFWNGRKGTNYLKKVIEKDPEYYDAYLGLGMYHYYVDVLPKFIKVLSFLLGGGGDREKGLEEVSIASSKGVFTNGEAKFILGDSFYSEIENNFKAALPFYKELIARYPHNLFFKMRLSLCYKNLYKHDMAIQTINDLLKTESLDKYPGIHTLLYRYLGDTYSDINKFEKAIDAFKSALPLLEAQKRTESWEYPWALYSIGDCYEMLGEIDEAHEYYSRISEEDKTGAYAGARARLKNPLTPTLISLARGANYLKCGKYTQAGEIFNALMEAELNNSPLNKEFIADLDFNIGRVNYETKEYQKSIQTFRKVVASNDVHKEWVKPWAHYFIGDCYREAGELEKAKDEFDIAYKYDNTALRLKIENSRNKIKYDSSPE